MTSLSITLPEKLAKASQVIAEQLGISRTQFIRQAIAHELEMYQAKSEQKAMAKSMDMMKKNAAYLKEFDEIMDGFNSDLPQEKEGWWSK